MFFFIQKEILSVSLCGNFFFFWKIGDVIILLSISNELLPYLR